MADPVLASVRDVFRAFAVTAVPAAAALDEDAWNRAEALVEGALARRPPAQRRQLALFLRAVDLLPLVRWGRRFPRLDPERRARFLHRLERSSLLALRRGTWGVRTLAYLGVYGLPEQRARIGYRAHPDGWDARGAGT